MFVYYSIYLTVWCSHIFLVKLCCLVLNNKKNTWFHDVMLETDTLHSNVKRMNLFFNDLKSRHSSLSSAYNVSYSFSDMLHGAMEKTWKCNLVNGEGCITRCHTPTLRAIQLQHVTDSSFHGSWWELTVKTNWETWQTSWRKSHFSVLRGKQKREAYMKQFIYKRWAHPSSIKEIEKNK